MLSPAQRWSWNAHPPYISSFENIAYATASLQQAIIATDSSCHLFLSIFPCSPPTPPPPKKNLATACIKSLLHFSGSGSSVGLQTYFQVFSPTRARMGNTFKGRVLKKTPRTTETPGLNMRANAYKCAVHTQLLCKVYHQCRICPNSEKLTSNPPPHSHIL